VFGTGHHTSLLYDRLLLSRPPQLIRLAKMGLRSSEFDPLH
jgi:hypothetical protein